MNGRYRLGGLDDAQLLASLSSLVRSENESLADLLAHLAELDDRELCLALGYPSLFAYCTEALGFCKSSAGRRIAAARVCRRFPEAFARVANGELQLSVLCALRPHLSAENASELLAVCTRKSYEQVELLLAARFPRPDVRDLIRRLPTRAQRTPHIGTEPMALRPTAAQPLEPALGPAEIMPTASEPITIVPPATERSTTEPSATEPPAFRPVPSDPLIMNPARVPGEAVRGQVSRSSLKALSVDRFNVNFTVDGEFRELLEEVRALLSHSEPQGDLMRVMKRGLETLRTELLKKRFGVGRKPRRLRLRTCEPAEASTCRERVAEASTCRERVAEASTCRERVAEASRYDERRSDASTSPVREVATRTRHVPLAVAREVYVRDQGRCTFRAGDGRRCEERRLLQLDHVVPHAEGGEPTVGNLRLRCRAHNLHQARTYFGKEYVRAAAQRARARHRDAFAAEPLNCDTPRAP